MIYLIVIIIVLTICLYLIYRDIFKIFKITSIVTVISGIFTFVVGYLVKYFMYRNLSFINVSDVIDIIVTKFVLNGIYMLILGLIEFTSYFILNYYFDDRRKIANT